MAEVPKADMLVTGASGGLGGLLLPLLRERGVVVRALSRTPHADGVEWVTGDTVRDTGLAEAVAGVGTVVHLAGGARGDDVGTAHLAAAAAATGVGHVVMISVVGADRMPIGYFRAKAAAEQALATSGAPWTVLRAAQFHTFVDGAVRAMTALPIALAPRGMRLEPVDGAEVAAQLAELALGTPQGRVPDLAGPEVLDADALVRAWLAARDRRRAVVHPGLPGAVGRAYRDGLNLAGPDADRGAVAWEAGLAARLATAAP